jgi:hypothetical protein
VCYSLYNLHTNVDVFGGVYLFTFRFKVCIKAEEQHVFGATRSWFDMFACSS